MKKNPSKRKVYRDRDLAKHRDHINKHRRQYRETHPEYGRRYARKIREEVLAHYGGKCACCGEDRYEFMSIDHVKGGGLKHRRELKLSGAKMIFWLKRNNYPEGFQVLCHNCNMALGHYGFCPHHPEITRPVLRGVKKYVGNRIRK